MVLEDTSVFSKKNHQINYFIIGLFSIALICSAWILSASFTGIHYRERMDVCEQRELEIEQLVQDAAIKGYAIAVMKLVELSEDCAVVPVIDGEGIEYLVQRVGCGGN